MHLSAPAISSLPPEIDLRPYCPPITDQGATNSCTGHAWAGLIDYLNPDGPKPFMPSSRRFLYWNMCDLEGTAGQDNGAYLRDGAKVAKNLGVPHEVACSFDPKTITRKPVKMAYTQAAKRKRPMTYHALYSLDAMLACLAEKVPFVFGFTVFQSFMSEEVARTGWYRMPDLATDRPIGGHAVVAVGYSIPNQQLLVRNSWGGNWGMGGFFLLPLEYVSSSLFSSDFFTARM